MHLSLNPVPRARRYKLESATRVQQGSRLLEYHEVVHLELALLGVDQGAWVFQLATQPVQATATSEVFTWAREVNAFLDKLVLRINSTGCIEGVLNQEELRGRWPAHRRALQQTYGNRPGATATLLALDQAVQQPEFLHTQLITNGLYDFLFPGLYRNYTDLPLPTTKVLKGFFGLLDLPLTLHTALVPGTAPSQEMTVRSVGQADTERLDNDGFRRFLKDVTDLYTIKTDLLADYEATYQLDSNRWLTTADLFLAVTAGGTAYRYTLARQLTSLP